MLSKDFHGKRFHYSGSSVILLLLLCFFLAHAFVERKQYIDIYTQGIQEMDAKHYDEAINLFLELPEGYQDSQEQMEEARNWLAFENAQTLLAAKRYDDALKEFSRLADIESFTGAKNARDSIAKCSDAKVTESAYESAVSDYNAHMYAEALEKFQELGDYHDSVDYIEKCTKKQKELEEQGKRLSQSTTISAGIRFSVGVTNKGEVEFAGETYNGETDLETWTDIVSVSCMGEFILGLKKDGTVVVANGNSKYRANTSDWRNIVAISAGQQFIAGLRADGTVTAQGYDGYGETKVENWRNIVAISTGWQHTVGLDSDGDVFDEDGNIYFVGYRSDQISEEIKLKKEEWTDLVAISTGGSSPGFKGNGHVVGLKSDKTVVAAGDKSYGQCNVYGPEWTDIVAIAAGDYHTVGLKSDGTVISTWTGDQDINEKVKKKTDAKIIDIAAGSGFTLALTSDSKVVGDGNYKQGQIETDGWEAVAYYK